MTQSHSSIIHHADIAFYTQNIFKIIKEDMVNLKTELLASKKLIKEQPYDVDYNRHSELSVIYYLMTFMDGYDSKNQSIADNNTEYRNHFNKLSDNIDDFKDFYLNQQKLASENLDLYLRENKTDYASVTLEQRQYILDDFQYTINDCNIKHTYLSVLQHDMMSGYTDW